MFNPGCYPVYPMVFPNPPMPPIGFPPVSGLAPGVIAFAWNPVAPGIPVAIGWLNVVYAGIPYVKGFAPVG